MKKRIVIFLEMTNRIFKVWIEKVFLGFIQRTFGRLDQEFEEPNWNTVSHSNFFKIAHVG